MPKTKRTRKTRKTKFRKYIFAVVFFQSDDERKFLLFHRTKNWRGWEFLKGGLKEGETEMRALKREIREETGAAGARKYRIVKTRHVIKYRWNRNYRKDRHLFHGARGMLYIVRLFGKKIKIDRKEHDKFRWVDKREALRILTYINLKNALKYVSRNHNL
ncbi:MAG TPA: NUDIX domain-containing protein [archaeon]|nr:NUDIX domain-containing protein [archaeon]